MLILVVVNDNAVTPGCGVHIAHVQGRKSLASSKWNSALIFDENNNVDSIFNLSCVQDNKKGDERLWDYILIYYPYL